MYLSPFISRLFEVGCAFLWGDGLENVAQFVMDCIA